MDLAEISRRGSKGASQRANPAKAAAHKKAPGPSGDEGRQKGPNWIIIAVLIAAAAIIGAIITIPSLVGSVPFSTFKSTFQSAPNVSIVAVYSGPAQYANESVCISKMVQVVAYTRKDSAIGVYYIDAQNSSCTYQQSLGLANPQYASASLCSGLAYSRPSITLNYSDTNSTSITASHMNVYGNSAYMLSCPVAVELS